MKNIDSRIKWADDRVNQLRMLVNEGVNNFKISKILGTTVSAVEHALNRFGISRPNRNFSRGDQRTRFTQSEISDEVSIYLSRASALFEKYKDIYSKVDLKTNWHKERQIENQVLLLSDMHTGMINKSPVAGEGITYDEKIQEHELQSLLRGVRRFHELSQPSCNIERLHIFSLGDLITNDRIYEGQQTEIVCGVGEQILKAFYYISDLIKHLLELYPEVIYIAEYGNHGRTTSQPIAENPKSNFEYLLSLLLRERFNANKRVKVILPDDYSYVYNIYKHRYLLTHGNIIRGCTLNSIEKAAREIALLVENEYYDVITIGHFHSCQEFTVSPTTTMLVNGCFIFKDSYAYTKLRKYSTAKQFLFNVSRRDPIHNVQKIDLRWK